MRGSPLRYLDLMQGRKPHLLVGIRNNLGACGKTDHDDTVGDLAGDFWRK
jgi:hypothetical protein